ncbi:hypothetical protein [Marinisporobacter balticus]|uniref:Uncharacterized protein n=1 Tax=Marinisporobacter balticus TaxID=2018667 RepID=A0A4R2L7F7_9FIRM|nr:hypothetical protein [Marinisporobacter balticus]TCO80069.1 hypothetical protein EV214_101307 [Marinisporobacter balticus]
MSIKKISSSNKARINTMYVNRNTVINQVNPISPIKKINKMYNQSFQSSQNNFFSTSNFYDHLKKLKEEYFYFYKVQQELEYTLKEFIHTDYKDLIAMIRDLVYRYNKSIISLKNLDTSFDTNYCQSIQIILSSYKLPLEKIGINIQNDYQLSLDESTLRSILRDNRNAIQFLLNTKTGFIRKLYNAFKNIKLPTYEEPYNITTEDSSSIIDKKC